MDHLDNPFRTDAGSLSEAPASIGSAAPPPLRGAMPPRPWLGFLRSTMRYLRWSRRPHPEHRDQAWHRMARAGRRQGTPTSSGEMGIEPPWRHKPAWEKVAHERRRALLTMIGLNTFLATLLMAQAQPFHQAPWLSSLYVLLFALLFAWVMAGCATAVMGFVSARHGDRYSLKARSVRHHELSPLATTAVVMPIRHEEIGTVYGGLQAMCESLAASKDGGLFDVFVLSDTSNPDLRVAEMAAFAELRTAVAAVSPELSQRIYYRWRQRQVKRKAGNVADFCRRWGRRYRYMVILDADSIMSADSLVGMVKLMEAHPDTGILQAAPHACGQNTVHGRAQQFAASVAGRMFNQGMQYWQLGESHYWGHNAIIRIKPFMRHCALPPLPGQGGLSGDILSHDFVEAALMRRAGYHVWMVCDLADSYEQVPPNLIEELKRDRRWCQGNLQNVRLIAEPGLHPVHRVMLFTGAMAYASAPLWLAFVGLGLYLALGVTGPDYGGHRDGWPAPILWTTMVLMLLSPRLMGAWTLIDQDQADAYGGRRALLKSVLLEAALSVLYAPVRMLAHTMFVVSALTGWSIEWQSPPRAARALPFKLALRTFGVGTASAAVGLLAMMWWAPQAWLLVLPITLPLLVAAPLSVLTSRDDFGERMRETGWLKTPEETRVPKVLQRAWELGSRAWANPGWSDALRDRSLFQLLCSLAPRRMTRGLKSLHRREWVHQALEAGPTVLDDARRMHLLNEPLHMAPLRAADGETTGTPFAADEPVSA